MAVFPVIVAICLIKDLKALLRVGFISAIFVFIILIVIIAVGVQSI